MSDKVSGNLKEQNPTFLCGLQVLIPLPQECGDYVAKVLLDCGSVPNITLILAVNKKS